MQERHTCRGYLLREHLVGNQVGAGPPLQRQCCSALRWAAEIKKDELDKHDE